MNATTKDIRIGNTTYQLGRLSARQGSWVAGQFRNYVLARLINPAQELDEKQLGLMLIENLSELSEATYSSIQSKCLGVCTRIDKAGDGTIPVPVLRADGTWNGLEEPGLPELLSLFTACLSYNLYPFFEPGAREILLAAFPDAAAREK